MEPEDFHMGGCKIKQIEPQKITWGNQFDGRYDEK